MSGTGLTLGPLALLLAVCAYVLKRWWDNADDITAERKRAYAVYFDACYHLTLRTFDAEVLHDGENDRSEYDALQNATPDFYLHASPTVLDISDIFFKRAMFISSDKGPEKGTDEFMTAAEGLQESLNALREAMKSELFMSSPRYQYEMWKRRRQWNAFLKENKK